MTDLGSLFPARASTAHDDELVLNEMAYGSNRPPNEKRVDIMQDKILYLRINHSEIS
jgi:hypothetical protein